MLLGDGAAAAIVVPSSGESRILATALMTEAEGKNIDVATLRGGGLKLLPSDPEFTQKDATFHVDGPLELKLALRHLPAFVERLLDRAGIGVGEFDHIIPHQVVPRMIGSIMDRLGITTDRLRLNTRYGNMGAASIPVVMADLLQQGLLKRGDKVLLIGGAAGFSLGGAVLVY